MDDTLVFMSSSVLFNIFFYKLSVVRTWRLIRVDIIIEGEAGCIVHAKKSYEVVFFGMFTEEGLW